MPVNYTYTVINPRTIAASEKMMMKCGIENRTSRFNAFKGNYEYYFKPFKKPCIRAIIKAPGIVKFENVPMWTKKYSYVTMREAINFVADVMCRIVKQQTTKKKLFIFGTKGDQDDTITVKVNKNIDTVDFINYELDRDYKSRRASVKEIVLSIEASDKPLRIVNIDSSVFNEEPMMRLLESLENSPRPITIVDKSPFNDEKRLKFDVQTFKQARLNLWTNAGLYFNMAPYYGEKAITHIFLPHYIKILHKNVLKHCSVLFINTYRQECSAVAIDAAKKSLKKGAKVYVGASFINTAKEITEDNIDMLVKMSLNARAQALCQE